MNIKNLPAAKKRAIQLDKQARELQWKIYEFADTLKLAGLCHESTLATEAGFEIDVTQDKLQDIFK